MAQLGALCGFVVQTLPLTVGRGWQNGGIFLPRRSEGAKRGKNFIAQRHGGTKRRDALREKGRGLGLHDLPVLHGGGSLRVKGGRLRLGRVLTAIPVSPGAMPVLSRAVPVLSRAMLVLSRAVLVSPRAMPVLSRAVLVSPRAILVLCTAMPVRCFMKNALVFPTNFPPITINQT